MKRRDFLKALASLPALAALAHVPQIILPKAAATPEIAPFYGPGIDEEGTFAVIEHLPRWDAPPLLRCTVHSETPMMDATSYWSEVPVLRAGPTETTVNMAFETRHQDAFVKLNDLAGREFEASFDVGRYSFAVTGWLTELTIDTDFVQAEIDVRQILLEA